MAQKLTVAVRERNWTDSRPEAGCCQHLRRRGLSDATADTDMVSRLTSPSASDGRGFFFVWLWL